jgi:hypothetical protein
MNRRRQQQTNNNNNQNKKQDHSPMTNKERNWPHQPNNTTDDGNSNTRSNSES